MFQCLLIDGENAGEDALREAERFVISDLQFQDFLDRHRSLSCLVPESNEKVGRVHWMQLTSVSMWRCDCADQLSS